MEQKNSGNIFPVSGGILLFTLLFGTIFVSQHPFHARRTEEKGRKQILGDAGRIPARLWEDPFSAVLRAGVHPDDNTTQGNHRIENLVNEINRFSLRGEPVDMLGIWLWGGIDSESVEWRIRCRYAALSALGVLKFRPDDAHHLSWLRYDIKPAGGIRQVPVPFEWFTLSSGESKKRHALLMWLDSEAFSRFPLAAMNGIADALKFDYNPDNALFFFGPGTSDDFKDMVREILDYSDSKERSFPALDGVTIYSPFVTVDASAFPPVPGASPVDSLDQLGNAAGVDFVRTIHTDRELAHVMRNELKARGIDPAKDSIALISEWDSLYASELMDTFDKAFSGRKSSGTSSNIYRYCYMRGLDGLVPGGAELMTDRAQGEKRVDSPASIERPVGKSQYDYLRRMGKILAARHGLKAVGVLGSDVYDKLLVLEALHDLLPDVIFFTTDLDARFFHPANTAWTRNLVVVSSMGLKLRQDIQTPIPPFRSSYQTSLFLAVQKVLGAEKVWPDQSAFNQMLGSPRIFEIGRGEAFDISRGSAEDNSSLVHPPAYSGIELITDNLLLFLGLSALILVCPLGYYLVVKLIDHNNTGRRQTGENTALILRPGPGIDSDRAAEDCAAGTAHEISRLSWKFWVVGMLCIIVLFTIKMLSMPSALKQLSLPGDFRYVLLSVCIIFCPYGFLIFRSTRGISIKFMNRSLSGMSKLLTGFVLSFLIMCICLCRGIALQKNGGEPLSFLGGISIWPSIILLMSAGIIAVFLLEYSNVTLLGNISHIQSVLQPCGARKSITGSCLNSEWSEYVKSCGTGARVARTVILWAGYFSIAFVLLKMDRPFVPFRGQASFIFYNAALTMAVIPMLFLVLWVADITKMCCRLADKMRSVTGSKGRRWCNRAALQSGIRLSESTWQALDSWFDIRLIAGHTESIAHMVYYPMIVIVIMLMARLSCFDRTDTPLSLVVVILVTMAHALYWPARLRRTVEKFRSQVLDEFRNALILEKGKGNDAAVAQLNDMIFFVSNLKKGAFRPFTQQPWVHVLMTLFGGGGGYAALSLLRF